jgi:hypothetical protein
MAGLFQRDGEELTRIADENPDLAITGWRNSDYTAQNFEEYRAGLFKAVDQYRAAKRFLHVAPRCPADKGDSSYSLKHIAEDFCETYIGNGALIAAALAIGLEVKRFPDSPNCRINVRVKRR